MRALALLLPYLIAAPVSAAGGDPVLMTCATLLRTEAATLSGPARQDALARAMFLDKAARGLKSPLLADLPPSSEAPPEDAATCTARFFPAPNP